MLITMFSHYISIHSTRSSNENTHTRQRLRYMAIQRMNAIHQLLNTRKFCFFFVFQEREREKFARNRRLSPAHISSQCRQRRWPGATTVKSSSSSSKREAMLLLPPLQCESSMVAHSSAQAHSNAMDDGNHHQNAIFVTTKAHTRPSSVGKVDNDNGERHRSTRNRQKKKRNEMFMERKSEKISSAQ